MYNSQMIIYKWTFDGYIQWGSSGKEQEGDYCWQSGGIPKASWASCWKVCLLAEGGSSSMALGIAVAHCGRAFLGFGLPWSEGFSTGFLATGRWAISVARLHYLRFRFLLFCRARLTPSASEAALLWDEPRAAGEGFLGARVEFCFWMISRVSSSVSRSEKLPCRWRSGSHDSSWVALDGQAVAAGTFSGTRGGGRVMGVHSVTSLQGSHGIEKQGKSRECLNSVFPVGKVGKKSGIQSFLTLKTELRHYSTYRNGRPLFGKCSSKEIQTCMFSLSKAKKNGRKIVKIDNK